MLKSKKVKTIKMSNEQSKASGNLASFNLNRRIFYLW